MEKLGDFYCPWKIKCASSNDFNISKLPISSYPYTGGLKYVWPTSLSLMDMEIYHSLTTHGLPLDINENCIYY